MPGKKAMLVISNGKSTRASGALDRTMKELSLAGVEVVLFDSGFRQIGVTIAVAFSS